MRTLTRSIVGLLFAPLLAAQDIEGFTFEVETLGGRSLRHEAFAGNVVIVDLWGTWCPPCREAIPVLEGLYRKYKHYGLEVIGFNYEGNRVDAADAVRKFASEHGITYPLALGTPAIQAQVPGFSAYPTMLLFGKGWTHAETHVGFDPASGEKLEQWVRSALGLAADPGAASEDDDEDDAEADTAEAEVPDPPLTLAAGTIFKPGRGDTGFTFSAEDIDGKPIEFDDFRGKNVVLALTSSWDAEAERTATLLQRTHDEHAADGVVVLAACFEIPKDRAARVAKIDAFRKQHGLGYRLFPAGLAFQKRIHDFASLPLFLGFDRAGKLVLRESGNSERVAAALAELLRE